MRKGYHAALKEVFHAHLLQARKSKKKTQFAMGLLLEMDERSYRDLEWQVSGCSAVTLVLFLLRCCEDPKGFLDEVQVAFAEVSQAEEHPPFVKP